METLFTASTLWSGQSTYTQRDATTASERGRFYHAGSTFAGTGPGPQRALPRDLRAALMECARELDRRSRSRGRQGILKSSALRVLEALLFRFRHPRTGRCDPSYETLAAEAGVSRASVHQALLRLEQVGLLVRERRMIRVRTADGRVGLRQTSNQYHFQPPSPLLHPLARYVRDIWDRWEARAQRERGQERQGRGTPENANRAVENRRGTFFSEAESRNPTEKATSTKNLSKDVSALDQALARLGQAVRSRQ